VPPDEISTWFVLTLSAEQAAREGDLEHLRILMDRREELLSKWTMSNATFSQQDAARVRDYEARLQEAMTTAQKGLRSQIERLNCRKKAVESYRAG
jgi:hypothetical protein